MPPSAFDFYILPANIEGRLCSNQHSSSRSSSLTAPRATPESSKIQSRTAALACPPANSGLRALPPTHPPPTPAALWQTAHERGRAPNSGSVVHHSCLQGHAGFLDSPEPVVRADGPGWWVAWAPLGARSCSSTETAASCSYSSAVSRSTWDTPTGVTPTGARTRSTGVADPARGRRQQTHK